MRRKRVAFTLIELLVIVSIICLLVAILLPSLNAARTQAKRVTCASQLHQVGLAMVTYLHDSRERMPYVSDMPSISPAPLDRKDPIYLADVLKKQLTGQKNVLECPNDRPGRTDRPAPNTGLSFFQSERSSYGYRTYLGGRSLTDMAHPWRPPPDHQTKIPPETIWFARDYESFHGKAGEIGARRYVYIDGHVSDYEN